jgi:hypothetical protein
VSNLYVVEKGKTGSGGGARESGEHKDERGEK